MTRFLVKRDTECMSFWGAVTMPAGMTLSGSLTLSDLRIREFGCRCSWCADETVGNRYAFAKEKLDRGDIEAVL